MNKSNNQGHRVEHSVPHITRAQGRAGKAAQGLLGEAESSYIETGRMIDGVGLKWEGSRQCRPAFGAFHDEARGGNGKGENMSQGLERGSRTLEVPSNQMEH